MGRMVINFEIGGNPIKALIDTGSLNSYVERGVLPPGIPVKKRVPHYSAIGGRHLLITEECLLEGKINGLDFSTDAFVVDELGKLEPEGIEFSLLLGARALEKYGIKVDPKTGELDLEGLRRREFTEF